MTNVQNDIDRRLMGACLRLARRHRGLTGTNPSVATLLVQFEGECFKVVGKGITAAGGRPHAERVAIDQAGHLAKGATAYVSLEPCAHHGATPPCAQALIDAGVSRVVTAWTDPDTRVDGNGHAMLREAGVVVETGMGADQAEADLGGYLNRKMRNQPYITLKIAISADGKLGIAGQEVAITGSIARSVVHRMRAEHDAILVGRGTVEADDPLLTCRLPGLEHRSPHRFILDTAATLPSSSNLAQTATTVPTSVITVRSVLGPELEKTGVQIMAAEAHDGRLALPEVLEDMASLGISSLMVEGGAAVVKSFVDAGLVDEIALFSGSLFIGDEGLASPISKENMPKDFELVRNLHLGDDMLDYYRKMA